MEGEQQQRGHTAEQSVRVQQGEERSGEVFVGVDRNPADDVGEGDAPQECGDGRADHDRRVPDPAPLGRLDRAAVLEGHAAHDQRHQDEQQRR